MNNEVPIPAWVSVPLAIFLLGLVLLIIGTRDMQHPTDGRVISFWGGVLLLIVGASLFAGHFL